MTTFDRARRGRAYARLSRTILRRSRPRDLLPLDQTERALRPFGRRYAGLREIPLSQIVGTDSHGIGFDRDFRPRRPESRERWQRVERTLEAKGYAPITVHKLGDAYFVIDGHHRVAIARQLRMDTIEAEVTELTARWHLDAGADAADLIHAEQERIFMEGSGLAEARPDLTLRFSRPVGYVEMLETVQVHGYQLMLQAGRALAPGHIAADWYERVYTPTIEAIHAARLNDVCPHVTDADRFLWLHQRRRELVPEHGRQPVHEAARRATEQLARRRRRLRARFRRAP